MIRIREEINWALACAKNAERNNQRTDLWMHRAFDALEYHLALFPEDKTDLTFWWNTHIKPQFETIIYGYSLTFD